MGKIKHNKKLNDVLYGRKKQIVEEAIGIFSTQGFSHTSVSYIMQKIGITASALYKYFHSKEELLFEVIRPSLDLLIRESLEHLQGIEGPQNKVRKFIFHLLDFLEKHAEFTKIYFLELRSNIHFYKSDIYKSFNNYRKILCQILEEGKQKHLFRNGVDNKLFIELVFGVVEHIVMGRILLQRPLILKSRLEPIFDLVYHSIIKLSEYSDDASKYKKIDRKMDILAAATHIFAKKGFSNSRVSDIATAAGIGDSTIYEYFKSKEDLLFSIPEYRLSFLEKDFNYRLNQLTNAENKMRVLTDHLFEFYQQNPDYVTILLLELRSNIKYPETKAYKFLKTYSVLPMGILRQGKDEGIFRPEVDERTYRDMFFGAIENVILRWRLFNDPKDLVNEKSKLFNLLIHAIAKIHQ
jgi:TetR/AcrR family fatty acid metabolism transcriptional regulator